MDFPEAQGAVQRILELVQDTSPIVVAVDGRSGTGKSTLSAWIARHLGATVIDQDDFYAGGTIEAWQRLTPREKADRVIDWRRVRGEALQPLRAGRRASWRPFDWEAMAGLASEPITAQPSRIVILDGAYSSRPELTDLIDLSILVTLPDVVRRARLMQREGEEFMSEWHAIWDEAEEFYFGAVRPPETFDVVIRRPADSWAGQDTT
jgi:uridine kinase